MTLDNLKTDLHTHSTLSSDATDSLDAMVKAAAGKGLKVLAVTNHVPEIPGFIWYHSIAELEALKASAATLGNQYGVKVLIGVEVNAMDYHGTLPLPDSFLEACDIVIAGVHRACCGLTLSGMSPAKRDDINLHMAAPDYYKQMMGLIRNPLVDIIAHPLWYLSRVVGEGSDEKRREVVSTHFSDLYREDIVKSAVKHGKAIELNAQGYPDDGFLRLIQQLKPRITLGSDAHDASNVGENPFAITKIAEYNLKNLVWNGIT